MDYTYQDLLRAYRRSGVERGKVVLLAPDLRWPGRYEEPQKEAVLEAHFSALAELVDLDEGCLVVSTPSLGLCNTDNPFDPATTPSELGVLTEYIRKKAGAIRSFHPFTSYTAIGRQAETICKGVSRHAFGPHSPMERMIISGARCVTVGLHPRQTCSEVHHCEMIMGVPYRYVKEFMHPVARRGQVRVEPFYMYVMYRDLDLTRGGNRKIFDHFKERGGLVNEERLGKGKVYGYDLAELVASTLELMSRDIYAWLERPPQKRPYRQ